MFFRDPDKAVPVPTGARPLIDVLRERYPDPVKFKMASGRGAYCVGGALMQYRNSPGKWRLYYRFPERDVIARVLMDGYDVLPHKAERYARRIIRANDRGNFDKAWRVLGKALEGHTVEREK